MPVSMFDSRGSDDDLTTYWLTQFDRAKSKRSNFDNLCSEVAQRIWPEADQFRHRREPGTNRRQRMFSSHGSRTLRKWRSMMISLVVPKTSQWQRFKASEPELNKNASIKAFFEEFTRLAFQVRNRPAANFYGAMDANFMERGAFGNNCFFLEELLGDEQGLLRYVPVAFSNVWIVPDHWGRVATVFYLSSMSAYAAHMKWRKVWGDNPPEKVKQRLEKDPMERLDFLHVVTPRKGLNPEALGPESMPFESFHFSVEDRALIDRGGYPEMPYIFSREPTLPNEDYGRGAAMYALPELHGVNQMMMTHFVAGEMRAMPPVLLSDDEFGDGARAVNLTPGALNRGGVDSRGNRTIQPYETGARIDISREMIQDQEQSIDSAFGIDLFRILFDDPRANVTATQILEEAQQRADLIAPGVNAIQADMLSPETERLVGIMSRAGRLPEVPPELIEAGNAEYDIEHTAPIDNLQRSGELLAIAQMLEVMSPLIDRDPNLIHALDAYEIGERYLDVKGGPPQVLRSREEFQAILQQLQQREEQAQQMAQLQSGAGAAKQGAEALRALQQ